jgi:hypothetical protein
MTTRIVAVVSIIALENATIEAVVVSTITIDIITIHDILVRYVITKKFLEKVRFYLLDLGFNQMVERLVGVPKTGGA